MKRMLIIGGSGLLGSRLVSQASKRFDTVGTYNPAVDGQDSHSLYSLDIGAKDEVDRLFHKVRPDFAILTAAVTDLEACENDKKLARKINVEGPEQIAKLCKKLDTKLIHLSSVYVFDGDKKSKYLEEDKPHPLSVYGETKLASEEAISSTLSDFIIARSAVMYGWPSLKDKDNFVTMTISRLRSKQPMRLYDDQFISPTLNDDLAGVLLDLCETDYKGILNTAGPDCMSRLKCGTIVADIFGLDESLIIPVSFSSMSLPAKRAMNACLDVSKVERVLKRRMTSFEDGIKTMKKQEELPNKR